MANIITAGNSTNGGTSVATDTSGTLNIVTGSGSGANAITIDASQNVTTLANLTVTGTLSASGGVSGGIRSGTAVASTSGTSIDFTSLPTGVKRITVMFSGVSTNGATNYLVQIGSGSIVSSGYISTGTSLNGANATSSASSTAGFLILSAGAANVLSGSMVLTAIASNTWVSAHSGKILTTNGVIGGGDSTALSGALDRIRITTTNGTDTFDAGSINILYE